MEVGKKNDVENSDAEQSVESEKSFEVTFDGTDDQENTKNLSKLHKWTIVLIISLGSLCVTCISSSWSLASGNIMKHFHVGHEVSTLGISLYILALGSGGIFLAPFSEYYGRKITYTIGLFLTAVFNLLPEFCDNLGGVLFGRFMSGFFASSFMSVASGTFADIFEKHELVYPMALYTISPFIGPGLGPLVSGFINTHINFRWTFHVMGIWALVVLVLVVLFVPETYPPVLLKRKAQRLRETSGDDRYFAPLEHNKLALHQAIITSSARPFKLLFFDRMTFVLCFYTGFCLAVVYMFFVAIPYCFEEVYGFTIDQVGMTFLGLVTGMLIASVIGPWASRKHHEKMIARNGGVSTPEMRFFSLEVGVFIVPIGLFIMAWTLYKHIHWMVPIVGSGIYGAGVVMVFNGIFGYTVDAYRLYAASAMAMNSFIRSVMSAAFPLFGLQMYEGLGVHWANMLLGLFATALIPIAFLFQKYGALLRSKSSYTWT